MYLAVGSNLELEMLLVVERLASHDGPWADLLGNASFHGEESHEGDCRCHDINEEELWDSFEWKAVSNCSDPFF